MVDITRNISITGVVQGVNFRRSTQSKALELQLSGWVNNLPDGSVQVFVDGEEKAVIQLIDWLHHGPQGARVKKVVVKEGGLMEKTSGFSIK